MKESSFTSLNRYETVQDLRKVKGGKKEHWPDWAVWMWKTYCRE